METGARLQPERVRVRLVDNPQLGTPARPTVKAGDAVKVGDVVAEAAEEGFSVHQHASIDGTVAEVTNAWIEIRR